MVVGKAIEVDEMRGWKSPLDFFSLLSVGEAQPNTARLIGAGAYSTSERQCKRRTQKCGEITVIYSTETSTKCPKESPPT